MTTTRRDEPRAPGVFGDRHRDTNLFLLQVGLCFAWPVQRPLDLDISCAVLTDSASGLCGNGREYRRAFYCGVGGSWAPIDGGLGRVTPLKSIVIPVIEIPAPMAGLVGVKLGLIASMFDSPAKSGSAHT